MIIVYPKISIINVSLLLINLKIKAIHIDVFVQIHKIYVPDNYRIVIKLDYLDSF